MNKATLGITG